MRKAVALFGLLGLVGCFLPLIGDLSTFDLRHVDALEIYLLLAAFTAPFLAGMGDKSSIAALVGSIGFGYVLFKFGFDTIDLVVDASIGGKMMAVAAVGGFACSLLGFAERDTQS